MRIGLSLLCEQPDRKTGLTSLFTAFVREALAAYEDLEVVLFCAEGQSLEVESPRLLVRGGFPANDRLAARLFTEYFCLGREAAAAGCEMLLTTGLAPLYSPIPTGMHLLTLHHLSRENRIGGLKAMYRRWASMHGLRRADLVITNTEFAIEQIMSVAEPAVAAKLLQSYEGIDHGAFHARASEEEAAMLRERFGIAPGYTFWSSNFYPYKQAELAMEVWCDLPREIREKHPMVMVGGAGWGDSKEKTLEIAKNRGAAEQVKVLGWVTDEEVPILFRHASLFVHPSREETFGRSVLEAMASGVPCVVQKIPVMHEVTAGQAWLVDYNDREKSAAAMLEALQGGEAREKRIAGGLSRAAEFSFRRLAIERIEAIRASLGLPATELAREFAPRYATECLLKK